MPLCEKHFLFLQWDEKSWLSQADLREWDQIDSHTFSGAWYQHTSNQFMIGYYCLPCAPTHCRASLNAGATLLRTAEHSKQINSSRQFRLMTARFSKPCEQSRVELFFFKLCFIFFTFEYQGWLNNKLMFRSTDKIRKLQNQKVLWQLSRSDVCQIYLNCSTYFNVGLLYAKTSVLCVGGEKRGDFKVLGQPWLW